MPRAAPSSPSPTSATRSGTTFSATSRAPPGGPTPDGTRFSAVPGAPSSGRWGEVGGEAPPEGAQPAEVASGATSQCGWGRARRTSSASLAKTLWAKPSFASYLRTPCSTVASASSSSSPPPPPPSPTTATATAAGSKAALREQPQSLPPPRRSPRLLLHPTSLRPLRPFPPPHPLTRAASRR